MSGAADRRVPGLLLSMLGLGQTPHDGSSLPEHLSGYLSAPAVLSALDQWLALGGNLHAAASSLVDYKIPTGRTELGRAAGFPLLADIARAPVYRRFPPLGPHSLWWPSLTPPNVLCSMSSCWSCSGVAGRACEQLQPLGEVADRFRMRRALGGSLPGLLPVGIACTMRPASV